MNGEPQPAERPRTTMGAHVRTVVIGTLDAAFHPRRLAERFDGIPADRQKVIGELVERSRASVQAADSLQALGHEPASQALLTEARTALREALSSVPADALKERGKAALDDAADALAAPVAEGDVGALRSSMIHACRTLDGIGWSASDVRRATWQRRLTIIGSILLVVVTALLARKVMRAPKAIASAYFGATYLPDMAIDGDVETDWLLPDHSVGFLELHLRPARPVKRIWLVNGRNAPFNDRGTEKFTVELYREDERVFVQEGTFSQLGANELREVSIQQTGDRLRITVNSFLGAGGGLAEVKLE